MKISLALGPREPLSRQTAWGCFTSNLALPGAGSLLAGRASGYGQLVLALVGMSMTMVFGLQFILWYFRHWDWIRSGEADPLMLIEAIWKASRWSLLGIAVFALAWLWGLVTGLLIVAATPKRPPATPPPRLNL